MNNSIAAFLESEYRFSTLMSIVKLAGLYSILDSKMLLTLLAPDNKAFERMAAQAYSRLINNDKSKLRRIIEYHILPGYFTSNDLHHGSRIQTLNGNDVTIYNKKGTIKINESTIVEMDIIVSNGIIHTLNMLL